MSQHRRALMISYPFPPAMSGGVFRILRFCKYLPQFDWEPIVLTPRPEAVQPITIDASLDALVPAGLEVYRTAVLRPVAKTKAALGRWRDRPQQPGAAPSSSAAQVSTAPAGNAESAPVHPAGLKAFLKSWEGRLLSNPDRHVGWLLPAVRAGIRIIRRRRPEVIYTTGPPHSTHLIGVMLKKLTGIPLVLDFRDPWAAREWTAARPTPQQRSAVRWERRCVKAADRVILNTEAVRRVFEQTYRPVTDPAQFTAIPNGLDPDFTRRIDALRQSSQPLPDGVTRLCHAGSVYGKRDLRPLAAAISLVAQSGRRIQMDQIGPVEEGRCAVPDADGSRWSLNLLGALPHDETLRRMAAADILVMIQPGNTLQIPGKLYEMLPYRKPILTLTGSGATAEVVDQYGLGPVVSPDDPVQIAEGIRWASSEAGQAAVAEGVERAMEAFDGSALTGRLADQFNLAVGR